MDNLYYSYSPDTGEYVGQGVADESPEEVGVFHYPAHSTTTPPLAPRHKKAVVFNGTSWGHVDDHRGETWYLGEQPVVITHLGPVNTDELTEEPVYPVVEEPVQEEPEMTLLEFAADIRYQREVSGTFWNGIPVHTDRESQSKISFEVLAIERGKRNDPDGWKFKDGTFRMVSNLEFDSLSDAVREHVRTSFAEEAYIIGLINSGEITSREEVEMAFGAGIPAEPLDEDEDGDGDGDGDGPEEIL